MDGPYSGKGKGGSGSDSKSGKGKGGSGSDSKSGKGKGGSSKGKGKGGSSKGRDGGKGVYWYLPFNDPLQVSLKCHRFSYGFVQFFFVLLVIGKGGMKSGGGGGGGSLCSIDVYGSGMQEVPAVQTDASASLSMSFSSDLSYAEIQLSVYEGSDITQAHLHCAKAGSNGPVVAFLFGPDLDGVDVDGVLSYGVLTNEDIVSEPSLDFSDFETCGVSINNIASLYEAILDRKIYLNVHSVDYPSGEVRAQVMKGCCS